MVTYVVIAVIIAVAAISLYKRKKKKAVKEVPQGLQIFDANGNCIVDLTDRISKYLGSFSVPINADSGTITNDKIGDGDLWYTITVDEISSGTVETGGDVIYSYPVITKGNGKLMWNYPHSQTSHYRRYGVTVHYGVY